MNSTATPTSNNSHKDTTTTTNNSHIDTTTTTTTTTNNNNNSQVTTDIITLIDPIKLSHSLLTYNNYNVQLTTSQMGDAIFSHIGTVPKIGTIHDSKSLVYYRGMIQNMQDPELYVAKYPAINRATGETEYFSCLYQDEPIIDLARYEIFHKDVNLLHSEDRQSVYCIPIPNENQWSIEKYHSNTNVSQECNGCNIVIYNDFDSLKLNQIYNFYGIIGSNIDKNDVIDDLAPTLHCILWQYIIECNPLLPGKLQVSPLTDVNHLSYHITPEVCRAKLITILVDICQGDELTAEYLLLNLISSVYNRKDVSVFGKFTLCLLKCPTDLPKRIRDFYQQVTTRCCYIPLKLDILNKESFIPKKDYSTEKLISGLLQLTDGTHLILDETTMESGKLETSGMNNVHALTDLITCQQVNYDFSYNTIKFNCDYPILVLSDANKPLLNYDIMNPFKINDNYTSTNSIQNLNLVDLTHIRLYLSLVKNVTYKIRKDMEKIVQDHFVMMRKYDSRVTGEDLHCLLSVSRYLSLSKGEGSLENSTWEKAKEIEFGRKLRIDKLPEHLTKTT